MAEKAVILLAVGPPATVAGFSGSALVMGLAGCGPAFAAGGVGGRGPGPVGGAIQLSLARG